MKCSRIFGLTNNPKPFYFLINYFLFYCIVEVGDDCPSQSSIFIRESCTKGRKEGPSVETSNQM
jgi:hypothetical protein